MEKPDIIVPSNLKHRPENKKPEKVYIPQVRPWIRYFARVIDYSIYFFIFAPIFILFIFRIPFFVDSIVEDFSVGGGVLKLLVIINILFWVFSGFIEAILLSTFGTTPGKYLFNIKLRTLNGDYLTFFQALTRNFLIIIVGFGLGIPIIIFITLILCFKTLTDTGTTFWDKDRFIVTHGALNFNFMLVAMVIFIASTLFSRYLFNHSSDIFLRIQKNENYAHFISIINKKLPIKIDPYTEITAFYFQDNALNYDYRITNIIASDTKKEVVAATLGKVKSFLCQTKEVHSILNQNTNLHFRFLDAEGTLLMEFTLTRSDCLR